MLDGQTLVNSLWTHVGGVLVFGILIWVAVKFFVGKEKNIPVGIGVLVGAAIALTFALDSHAFMNVGSTIVGWITGSGGTGS